MWDNGETSWKLLVVLYKDDLVTLASYAKERKLLEERGWKWTRSRVKKENKLVRLMKAMKASKKNYRKKSFGKKIYKFGVLVHRTGDVRGTMMLDKENGNHLWFKTQKAEANTLRQMKTFVRSICSTDLRVEC